ncbi:General secretion pathway protein K [Burkholderiales bacterium 8X]|nr:General secretion pathway protein K [Burkholderiales bacterium 8X]
MKRRPSFLHCLPAVRSHGCSRRIASQRGAALLTAMLTVTLVATFAAAALWQQWRAAEVEAAERARVQASWVLIGALDWSRLILREDARANALSGGADHLAEPWAVPLEEAKLSSFLSAEKNVASDSLEGLPEAFLSGRITDAQAKLNVLNLVNGGKPDPAAVAAFTKLFDMLGLPAQELSNLTASLQRALPLNAAAAASSAQTPGASGTVGSAAAAGASPTSTTPSVPDGSTAQNATATGGAPGSAASADSSAAGPLLPQRVSQLVWLGLSAGTVAALQPYVTVLPVRTPLNINTASAEALFASVPSLDLAGARRIALQRTRGHFRSLADAAALVQQSGSQFVEGQHSVATRFFEVQGRLRLDRTWVEEQSLLQRDGIDVRIVWRERGAGTTPAAPRS